MAESDANLLPPPARRIFCNGTLNLRTIGAIGYDMDYTLVHYRVATWEEHAYRRIKELLAADRLPVEDLRYDPGLMVRGLVIDSELGNTVKANRFGYVTKAFHGTSPLDFEQQRTTYRRTPVDLADPRFFFLNTLFSLSASCLYAQLVDLHDREPLPDVQGYMDLFRRVSLGMSEAHIEGTLKEQIAAEPGRFVKPDPQAPLALLDQQRAGKRLMLITNSDWRYTRDIMAFAFDQFLPEGMGWRDLFELVIVGARKPEFFSYDLALFRIVDEEGLLRPVPGAMTKPGLYLGGDAAKVEDYLGLSGSEILYVGDHIFADVRMSKSSLRWRTGLVLRELEREVESIEAFRSREGELARMMAEKKRLEVRYARLKLDLQRLEAAYGPQPEASREEILAAQLRLREQLLELDAQVVPLAREAVEIVHPLWGPLLRAGNDKSHLAQQVEKSADIYTSRVSNFLHATPFAYLRATRESMPHDPGTRAADAPTGTVDLSEPEGE